MAHTVRIVCWSDTHNVHQNVTLPEGDILIHAGDFTRRGSLEEIEAFNQHLATLPHPHKVVIAGNHDFGFEREAEAARALMTHCIYLEDQSVTIEGLRIYGSPWQPWFFNFAFNLQRGAEIREKWEQIPTDTDILITHGPPLGHGDQVTSGDLVGCADLREVIRTIQPRFHIFGHIHEAYGVTEEENTTFVNASCCDLSYEATQAPHVFDLDVNP